MPNIEIAGDLKELLDGAGVDPSIEGKLEAGAWYTLLLERGSSEKAPQGLIATHMAEYNALLLAEVRKALEAAIARNDPNLGAAIRKGFDAGVKAVLRKVEDYTPVASGKARSSWVATLSGGRKVRAVKHESDAAAARRKNRRRRKDRRWKGLSDD